MNPSVMLSPNARNCVSLNPTDGGGSVVGTRTVIWNVQLDATLPSVAEQVTLVVPTGNNEPAPGVHEPFSVAPTPATVAPAYETARGVPSVDTTSISAGQVRAPGDPGGVTVTADDGATGVVVSQATTNTRSASSGPTSARRHRAMPGLESCMIRRKNAGDASRDGVPVPSGHAAGKQAPQFYRTACGGSSDRIASGARK
jgi:hypothetical protein